MIIYIEQNIFTNLLCVSLTCLTILLITLVINLLYKNNKLFLENKFLTFINWCKKHKDKFNTFFKLENFKLKIANIILFLYALTYLFYNDDTIYKGLSIILFLSFILLHMFCYILSFLNKDITNTKFYKIIESIDITTSTINPFFVPLSVFVARTNYAQTVGIVIFIMFVISSIMDFFFPNPINNSNKQKKTTRK